MRATEPGRLAAAPKVRFHSQPIPNGYHSTAGYLQVKQRAVLLAAEDVGVTGATARHPAVDRELDRHCRVERDVVGELLRSDAEDPADRSARQDAALAHAFI